MIQTIPNLQAGKRVKITQVIHGRAGDWSHDVEGRVESVEYRPTGSWFAHGKRDRVWLCRVMLRKPDGELALINLDYRSQVSALD